jgi:plastocyanin
MKKPLLFINFYFLFLLAASAQTTHTVSMASTDMFSPASITINKGDIITWHNDDTDTHTSTSGSGCTADGLWNSGNVVSGASFSRTFSTVGSFPYHCSFHCAAGMVGTVTVNDIGVSGTSHASVLNFEIKSFPNPFQDQIELEFELTNSGLVKMEVFTMQGVKIRETEAVTMPVGTQSIKISTSDLMAGIYLCKIYYNGDPSGSEYLVKAAR